MSTSTNFIVWGSSGHAKVLAEIITKIDGTIIAFFDKAHDAKPALPNIPIYVGLDGWKRWQSECQLMGPLHAAVAIGGSRGKERMEIQSHLMQSHILFPPLIHPSAHIGSRCLVGDGSHILAQANLACESHLGSACILNHKASVDHECKIGPGCHLAPGATLCGCVELGNNVMIGAGAVVLPRITIGSNTIIGAGAVVTRDLPANIVAYGTPARIVRHLF